MKIKQKLLLPILISALMSACSSPFPQEVRFDKVSFDSNKQITRIDEISPSVSDNIENLTNAIIELGPDIDRKEASFVARESILYAMHLANEYQLISPPNSHNVLVNTGKREKGLCYHFARDMSDHIVAGRTYKTLTLQRAVAFQGKALEHNVLTVAAKGKGIKDAIILDAWRHSANLFWIKTEDDPGYHWKKYTRRVAQQ